MIYWFTSNLWSIAQQFVAERIMPVPAAAAAVLEKDQAKSGRGKTGGKAAGPGSPVHLCRRRGFRGRRFGRESGWKEHYAVCWSASSADRRSERREERCKRKGQKR